MNRFNVGELGKAINNYTINIKTCSDLLLPRQLGGYGEEFGKELAQRGAQMYKFQCKDKSLGYNLYCDINDTFYW